MYLSFFGRTIEQRVRTLIAVQGYFRKDSRAVRKSLRHE